MKTSSAFSFAQANIDHVLRLGGNEDDARKVIAAAFQKQKSTEDIAALLQNTFHGGNGFKTPEGELSAWYAVDGIHIARFYENLDRELAALCGGEKTEY